MKKTELKRIGAALLSTVCLISGGLSTAAPAVSAAESNIEIARLTNLKNTTCTLSINSSGLATCSGKTSVSSGYTAGVTIYLQQYDGGWNTIKSWSDKGSTSITLTKTKSVSSGYKYRLMVAHGAYNSSGTLVESNVTYSDVESY